MIYYVYIMSNPRHTILYTGVTNDIQQRSFEHKVRSNKKSFTARYNCYNLVYYEEFGEISEAIHREKQLKKYRRVWKEELITKMNAGWKDLSEGWFSTKELEFAKSLNSWSPQNLVSKNSMAFLYSTTFPRKERCTN